MVPPPTVSSVTSEQVPPSYLHSDTVNFRDTSGRSVILRGVNLSGSTKAPFGQSGHELEGFWEGGDLGNTSSWVGRPINLEDGSGDVHLARLRAWGYNCIRYVFTWEALEHAGPKKYDYEYMDYVVKVLRRCKEFGFRVYMDPHQDIWSRFCGGSGAPFWTLHACGMEPRNFTATSAAYLQPEYPSPENPNPEEYPAMIWSTNYTHLACQTVFTLFFGGRDFAPLCVIDGKNIQDFLQDHYYDAVAELAIKISEAGDLYDSCVIGWDSLNEPGEGLIGHEDIGIIPQGQALKKGPSPTAFEGMKLGMGQIVDVENWVVGGLGPSRKGNVRLDPRGLKAWLSENEEKNGSKWGWKRGSQWKLGTCIWAQHGVWDIATGTLNKPHYFVRNPGTDKVVDFVQHYWRPHFIEFGKLVRKHHPEAILFVQPPVFHKPPGLPRALLSGRACSSPHFYDGLTLLTKHWNWFNADALGILRGNYSVIVQAVRVGDTAIRNVLQKQLGIMKEDTEEMLGAYPTLMGEIGIPYDMDGRQAYGYTEDGRLEGDYSAQQKALDGSLNACDGPNMLNWTLWTYVPDNSHRWGDQWNGEDLSIWSEDDTDRGRRLQNPVATSVAGQMIMSSPNSSASSSATQYNDSDRLIGKCDPMVISQGDNIPPELIYDGARALPAFCRPFPIATVGRPERLDFDIKSSVCKYSVIVSPDDESSDQVMTEIYLPYVHYATNDSPIRSMVDDDLSSLGGKSMGMKVDVDVEVSTGRYEVQGQTLRWWYDIPSIGSSQKDRVYRITIKRKGGALRRNQVKARSWLDSCTIA